MTVNAVFCVCKHVQFMGIKKKNENEERKKMKTKQNESEMHVNTNGWLVNIIVINQKPNQILP